LGYQDERRESNFVLINIHIHSIAYSKIYTQKGVHQKIGNYKLDLGDNGPVYMEEHILSDVLRNVTNQIAVPFGAAVLATEETTISADVFGELQGDLSITFNMIVLLLPVLGHVMYATEAVRAT
jgi:hypothetical protein